MAEPIERKIQTLQFLIEQRLKQWNERRSVEWRALIGFVTLIAASGAVVLSEKLPLAACSCKFVFGLLVVMAALAVIWFLCELQDKNEDSAKIIRKLCRRLLALVSLLEDKGGVGECECIEAYLGKQYDRWALPPQILFIASVTTALLFLLAHR